jgi:riboflavin kinase/FMN adenylyltransferase
MAQNEFRGQTADASAQHIQVANSADEWTKRFGESRKQTAVTIGNFDGVHLGHQKILHRVLDCARRDHLMSAVLTFYPHPARVLRPDAAPGLLMTRDQRLAAFDAMGIEAALVMQFDVGFAKVTAEDFAKKFLVDALRARVILVGGNFRFGHRQAGDVKLLAELGKRWGFDVQVVAPVIENGAVISSTAIRHAVCEGQVAEAARMLGRSFVLSGEIRPGTGQGRKLIVPTLNLATQQEIIPKNGVYATETVVEGKAYRSVTNVGVRPTFDGHALAIESHLFDFSKQLTSGPMEVRFLIRLRDEQKFSGPEALREQVLKDIDQAKRLMHESESAINTRR